MYQILEKNNCLSQIKGILLAQDTRILRFDTVELRHLKQQMK